MGTLRIIPLLIAFTIASFAAHLAEVVFDMRTMLSRAYAETPAPAPASAPPSPAAPAPAPN
ncbi:MAG: sporulation protein, partial [Alphaproteobacteria bacterium]|nr:sporulation protein [Alphaproteobacteria bacterium]